MYRKLWLGITSIFSRQRLAEEVLHIGLIIHGLTTLGSLSFVAVLRLTVRPAAWRLRTRLTLGRTRLRLSALALLIMGI